MRTDPMILICVENGSNSLFSPIICSPTLACSTGRGSTDPTSRQPQILRQHMYQNFNYWVGSSSSNNGTISTSTADTHVEGWHSCLKKAVRKSHTNIFELIKVIKKEEATTWTKISLYKSGAKERPRRIKESLGCSIDEYLDSFKHHTGLYIDCF